MKIKIILAFFFVFAVHGIIKDLNCELNSLKKKYPKLQSEWFLCMKEQIASNHYRMTASDICAIIQNESEFNPNARHSNIRNGKVVSIDYSLMQINSCLGVYDEPIENLKKGMYEYNLCLIKAKYDKKTANRFYNAGRNNKAENYNNWQYVINIDKDRIKYEVMSKDLYIIK